MAEIPKTVEVPRYLLTGDTDNLAATEPNGHQLWKEPNDGYIEKKQESLLNEVKELSNRGQFFKLPISLKDIDFTLEISFKGICDPIHFKGDNDTISNTWVRVSKSYVTVYQWKSYWQRIFAYNTKLKRTDDNGFTHYTLVKRAGRLYHYILGVLVWHHDITNRFDSDEIYIMKGNYDLHRFAFTPYVTLPPEFMYTDSNVGNKDSDNNLALVNLDSDVYGAESYSNKMVTDFSSYGNWIIVKFNDGTMTAFNRPRGVDSGTTLVSVELELETMELVLTDENSKVYRIPVRVKIAESESVPEGTGILSVEGKHKPIVGSPTLAINKLKASESALVESSIVRDVTVLENPSMPLTNRDYSRRAVIRELVNDGALMAYPKSQKWEPLTDRLEQTVSNFTDFDLESGNIKLKGGRYLISGLIDRFGLTCDFYGIQFKVGPDIIFSRMFPVKTEWGNYRSGMFQFKFEDIVEVPYEDVLSIQQFIPSHSFTTGVSANMSLPVKLTEIEIFKV